MSDHLVTPWDDVGCKLRPQQEERQKHREHGRQKKKRQKDWEQPKQRTRELDSSRPCPSVPPRGRDEPLHSSLEAQTDFQGAGLNTATHPNLQAEGHQAAVPRTAQPTLPGEKEGLQRQAEEEGGGREERRGELCSSCFYICSSPSSSTKYPGHLSNCTPPPVASDTAFLLMEVTDRLYTRTEP